LPTRAHGGALFDDRRRTVHDRLAGTQVVHVRPMLGPVNR